MTKQQYADYEARVASYLDGIEAISTGPCSGCDHCELSTDDYEDPWFSWAPCEVCNRPLSGLRESWHGIADGKVVHGSCCLDCVYYLNYGRLDDQTMMEIERSKQ